MSRVDTSANRRWLSLQLRVAADAPTVAEQMAHIGRPMVAERAATFQQCAEALLLLEAEGIIDRQQFISMRGRLQNRIEMHSTGLSMATKKQDRA